MRARLDRHGDVDRAIAFALHALREPDADVIEKLHALAIEQQFHLLGFRQAYDVFVAVAGQSHLKFVFGIERKRISEGESSACTEGKLVEMLLLAEVGREVDGFAPG